MIIIILLLLILCILFNLEKFTETPNIELVIARYNEDLNWLNEEPFNKYPYIVYNKGNNG